VTIAQCHPVFELPKGGAVKGTPIQPPVPLSLLLLPTSQSVWIP